jgi:hypothetical protein
MYDFFDRHCLYFTGRGGCREGEGEMCVYSCTYLWYFMVCYLYRVHPVGCLCASVEREISTFLPTKFLPTCYMYVAFVVFTTLFPPSHTLFPPSHNLSLNSGASFTCIQYVPVPRW